MSFSDLENCIKANITSSNNDVRSKAEGHLKELKSKHAAQYFQGICGLISNSKDDSVRSFCAVLLKQDLSILDETFFRVSQQTQDEIKQMLLTQIKCETNQHVLLHVSESLGNLACLITHHRSEWKELMPFLFNLCQSPQSTHRQSFYMVICQLATLSLDVLRGWNMSELKKTLISGMKEENLTVRSNAITAVSSMICCMNEAQEIQHFVDLIPLLFQNIQVTLGDEMICKTIENLQILTDSQPTFFDNNMDPIIECLVNVSLDSNNKLQWQTRRLSTNLLVSFLQYHISEIEEKLDGIAMRVIPLIFRFLSDFDENMDWTCVEDLQTEQVNFEFASEMLEIIIPLFGPDLFMKTCKTQVFDAGFSDNCDWKQRLIALKALEISIEGCYDFWELSIANAVNIAIKSLMNCNNYQTTSNKQHSFIEYYALAVIKQLSVVYGDRNDIYLNAFHSQIMNALNEMLLKKRNCTHKCVLIQVCDCIAHFAYTDEDSAIIPDHAPLTLKGLYQVLNDTNNNNSELQSYALKAVSVIASIIDSKFEPFYDTFMGKCQSLLSESSNNKNRSDNVRGRTMECIGNMIGVVSFDKCNNDAHKTMKLLIPLQKQEKEFGGESYTFMLSLFANIARSVLHEFAPYLQHVIPPLILSAKIQSLTVSTENKENDDANDKNVIVETFGGIQFRVNTAEMNEKVCAINQFQTYAEALEGDLLLFVKPIIDVLIPLFKTRAQSSLRKTAIETMPSLVNCVKCGLTAQNMQESAVNEVCQGFVSNILPALVIAMQMADNVDELAVICSVMNELFDYINPSKFNGKDVISDITEQIGAAISERQLRREFNLENDADLDGKDDSIVDDVEAELADAVTDLICKMAQMFSSNYIVIFDEFCGELCVKSLTDISDNVLAITVLTEMIKFGGNASSKYVFPVLEFCNLQLQSINNLNSELRQSIAYAIGVCAIHKCLKNENVENWFVKLKGIINDSESRSDENATATENAISAIAKIFESYNVSFENNRNDICNWIMMLPLVNDSEERQFCNAFLLNGILKKCNIAEFNAELLYKIIHVIAVAIANDDTHKQGFQSVFEEIIKNKKSDTNAIKQYIQTLPIDLQNAFQTN